MTVQNIFRQLPALRHATNARKPQLTKTEAN